MIGLPVVVSHALPLRPSHREDARRLVRHGLADVLAWLGEAVGPPPGAPTHALTAVDYAAGGSAVLFVSQDLSDRLRAKAHR